MTATNLRRSRLVVAMALLSGCQDYGLNAHDDGNDQPVEAPPAPEIQVDPLVLDFGSLSVAETGAVPSGDLLVTVAVFAAGALAFHLGALGGGDVKLMAAGALWTGAGLADEFLMITLMAGGVLALAYLARGPLDDPGLAVYEPLDVTAFDMAASS